MARCQICCRKPNKVASRSHSMRKTIRRQKLNLHKMLYQGKKILACAACIQTQAKPRRK